MKKQLLAVWLLIPVGAGAYHLGPGQDRILIDDATQAMAVAEEAARRAAELEDANQLSVPDWARAAKAYEDALRLLPADQIHARRGVRLELAKCRMFIAKLPEANAQLQDLVDEMAADDGADPDLLRGARHALASSQYYMTWLQRLVGAGGEEGEPTIEAARQTFKMLVEEIESDGDEALLRRGQEDLESAIRLARMNLSELQGLPLPSQ